MILDNPIYGLLAQLHEDNKKSDSIDKKDIVVLKECLKRHYDMYLRYTQLVEQANLATRMGDGKWEDSVCQYIDTEFLHGNGPAPVKKGV